MRFPIKPAAQPLAKPTALKHAVRREQKARFDKPVFDPRGAGGSAKRIDRETDRWIDKNGRFTIPHTKEQRK